MLTLKWMLVDKSKVLQWAGTTLFLDNIPQSHLQTAKLRVVVNRWCVELEQLDFTLKYKTGQENNKQMSSLGSVRWRRKIAMKSTWSCG